MLRFKSSPILASCIIVFTTLYSTIESSFAKGLGQQVTLDPLVITSSGGEGSLTAPGVSQAREELKRIPGGIGFVDPEEYLDDFAQSLGDALLFTPGVFADTSAQRENRISIRGSGLNSSFERRGISVFRDGIPITRASGSTEFQEIDPLSIRYFEIFKGANGLRYGDSSLGGAINIVTPTGYTAKNDFSFRLEGGSFETVRGNASIAGKYENFDYYGSLTGLSSDGFRDHSEVRSGYGFANVGYRFSDNVETRFYFTGITDNFELAGALPLDLARTNPKATRPPITIGPFFPNGPVTVLDAGPIADDWDRNLDIVRIANRTVADLGFMTLEGGAWYSYRKLDHAITRFAGIIDQEEDEIGVFARGTGSVEISSLNVDWTLGARANLGDNDARTWQNNFGSRGALRTQNNQQSDNIVAYAQFDIHLLEQLSLILGGQYVNVTRQNYAEFNDVSGKRGYSSWNPRAGLLWDLTDSAQLFFNVNRSFEPPTMADLTAGGALSFTPLDPQHAWTVEIGTRGQTDDIAWDLSLYRSWVDNELVDFSLAQFGNTVSRTTNADQTIHQGIEAGLDVFIRPQLLEQFGLWFTWRNVLTVNDFFFDGDQNFGNNSLAGVPDFLYVTELRLNSEQKWYLGANLRWVPYGPWADYANTFKVSGYQLLGFTAGWEMTDEATLFVSAENVLDKRYISNVTTVADFSREPRAAIFTPGQGAAIFGGITLTF